MLLCPAMYWTCRILFVLSQFIITLVHTKLTRYESKNIQPPADVMQRLANVFAVSIDYQVNGNKSDKVEQKLIDADLIKQIKQLDKMPKMRKNLSNGTKRPDQGFQCKTSVYAIIKKPGRVLTKSLK